MPIPTSTKLSLDKGSSDGIMLKLFQLCSANLPVGAYAFSQGLEYAIESAWLKSADDVEQWLEMQLHQSLARVDLPILLRIYQALENKDEAQLIYWNDYLLSCRESKELRLGDTATGEALNRLLLQLDVPLCSGLQEAGFVALFAQAAFYWQCSGHQCALGLAWSWLENQVMAATKIVPLGQTRAQQLSITLSQQIPSAIEFASNLPDDELGACLPGLAIASMQHETQYSRLFRS